MTQYSIHHLQPRDLDLYHDICHSNGVIPGVIPITQGQIELLISVRGIVVPYIEATTRGRLWRILGKTKHGGHLTQAFSRKFFLS